MAIQYCNYEITGTLKVSGTGDSSFVGDVGIGTVGPAAPLHIKSTNFWLPEATRKKVEEVQIKLPESCPRCPVSGKALKSKHLIALNFTRDNSVAFGERGNIVCGVSQKAINHQKATVLKSCGHVILSSSVQSLVLPSMQCPVCNKRVSRKKDIVELKQGGSSYSGGGQAVVSTKYKTGVR